MSVLCTELLKTAEIQPCYSFSPEALSSPNSTACSWSPAAVKGSNVLLAVGIGNSFFTPEMPFIPAGPSLSESSFTVVQYLCSHHPSFLFCCSLVTLVALLQRKGILFFAMVVPLCPHLRGGICLLPLEICHPSLFSEPTQLRLGQPENFFRTARTCCQTISNSGKVILTMDLISSWRMCPTAVGKGLFHVCDVYSKRICVLMDCSSVRPNSTAAVMCLVSMQCEKSHAFSNGGRYQW